MSILIADHGLEAYARYWILLEFLAEDFDGKSTTFRYHTSTIRELVRVQSATKLQLVVNQLGTVRGLALRQVGTVFEIEAPILLDLLGRDFKKARSERASAAPEPRLDKDIDKEEDKEIVPKGTSVAVVKTTSTPATFDAANLDEVLGILGKEKANAWMELYNQDQDFIMRELRKAWQYYGLDNPKKKPKSKRGWAQCLSSWLERGWGYHAKNTPAAKQDQVYDPALENAKHFVDLCVTALNDKNPHVAFGVKENYDLCKRLFGVDRQMVSEGKVTPALMRKQWVEVAHRHFAQNPV